MKEQLKIDFEKIVKISNLSEKDIELKKNHLNKFIESGFPSRKLENWKLQSPLKTVLMKLILLLIEVLFYKIIGKNCMKKLVILKRLQRINILEQF